MGTETTPPREVKRHFDVHSGTVSDSLKRLKQTDVVDNMTNTNN
jgi:hypothetical protein